MFNWETAKYGKIWYDEDVHDLRSIETELSAIFFNDNLTSNETLFCETTVSSLNENEIDFRISFDESNDEDYTPSISCIDDLDFFKDCENEFPAIVYNDNLTSKSDFSTEPTLCPQHIDEFDLKNETLLSEYDEVEKHVLYFNDLFPFNIIYPDDLKSDKDNDDNEINMIQSSGGNENTQGSNNLLEGSHDKINKVFIMKSFVMKLNVNIVAWNYLVNGMLFNLIKKLYVPFGILFDPRWHYKDGDCTRMLRRPRYGTSTTEEIVHDFEKWFETIFSRQVKRVHILDFEGLIPDISIPGRGQALVKVTATDLFYLHSMDRGAANVMYLLAQYLFRHANGRNSGVWLSGGYFIGHLAHHFGLVAPGQKRQPDAAAGAPRAAKDAPAVDEGA
ncbi:hypothetical protein Tco_0643349 [Tanacetum coccineum]